MGTLPVGFLARNSGFTLSLLSSKWGLFCRTDHHGMRFDGAATYRQQHSVGFVETDSHWQLWALGSLVRNRQPRVGSTHDLHMVVLRGDQGLERAEVTREAGKSLRFQVWSDRRCRVGEKGVAVCSTWLSGGKADTRMRNLAAWLSKVQ